MRLVLGVYWVLLAVSTHMPDPGLEASVDPFGVFQIDKGAHVIAFGGLTLLLILARLAGKNASVFKNALVATLVAASYAPLDEFTQHWAGRVISAADLLAGLIGIVGVFLVATAPPPRDRAPRPVIVIRVLAAMAITLVLVMALSPSGNLWFRNVVRPFFVPWPGIDKAGHYYTAAVISLLVVMAQPFGVRRPRRGVAASILVMGLAGPILETAQSFTGRDVEVADVYAHEVGLFTAMLGLSVFVIGRTIRTRKTQRTLEDG